MALGLGGGRALAARCWRRGLRQAAAGAPAHGAAPSRLLAASACFSSSPEPVIAATPAAPTWLAARALSPLDAFAADEVGRRLGEGVADVDQLSIALAPEVASIAVSVASQEELRGRWPQVLDRLKALEFDAMDAVLLLYCMIRMDCFDQALLTKLVDRIECRYFNMELGIDSHTAADMFVHSGDFRSLVDNLPVDYKVKIVLMDDFERGTGQKPRPKPLHEADAKAAWQTMEPVDMEEVEKERFQKGRIRVKQTRPVQAKVTRMRPGNKLRAVLAVQLMQSIPTASLSSLAQIAQVCAAAPPKARLLHGDLRDDFREALARRLCEFNTGEIAPYVLAFASAMGDFQGSAAFRAWKTRLLPATLSCLLPEQVFRSLDDQRSFHPRLRGLQHPLPESAACNSDEEEEVRRMRIDRAAKLFISVVSAKQVDVDCRLFHVLAKPVKLLLREWLETLTRGDDGRIIDVDVVVPLDTLADTFSALASCGVSDAELSDLLVSTFMAQFGADISDGRLQLSSYHISDLSAVAHASTISGSDRSELMSSLWQAASPKLRESAPHLALMLLDAVVRGGSEELLTSEPVLHAVDELLVQKLDYDPAVLGHLGI